MLTLVVVAKNEADRIARCLRSVPFAARRLVLDSGSVDDTVAISRSCGAEVVETDWPGFVAQKNRALAHVDTPLALSLDADEWLTPDAARSVERICMAGISGQVPMATAGWSFARVSLWQGRPVRHGAWYPDRKLRLVRMDARPRWGGDDPHDRLIVDGPVERLGGDIAHDPYRRFADHLRTIDRYSALNAASLAERGVTARRRDPWVHGLGHFAKSYVLRHGYRDGGRGLVLAGLGAVHAGLKWHRLHQLSRS
jgi:glycosyltransferase involved in cell wall biosynthesis